MFKSLWNCEFIIENWIEKDDQMNKDGMYNVVS